MAVVAAMAGGGCEALTGVVGYEEGHTAGCAVNVGGLHGPAQVRLCGHVRDGIVDEDGVKLPAQPHAAHIAFDVNTLRVEIAADPQHAWRAVDQGQFVVGFQMGRVVAAAAAQFEYGVGRGAAGSVQHLVEKGCFVGIVFGRREQRPPCGQFRIEFWWLCCHRLSNLPFRCGKVIVLLSHRVEIRHG